MWPVALIVFEAFLILGISARGVHHVKPSGSPTDTCPDQPCLVLSDLTASQFTTGTTFLFLAGNHSLETSLNLTNISDVTLRGAGNTSTGTINNSSMRTVVLIIGQRASILCNGVSNLVIEGLTFSLCHYQCEEDSALQFFGSGKIVISNSAFQGTIIEGLRARSIDSHDSNITVLNCVFEANTATSGGAIHGRNSVFNITGSTFIRNRAQHSGGAIRMNGSTIILEGHPRNIFLQNTVNHLGGALWCGFGCKLVMTGNNTFSSNRCGSSGVGYGGALCVNEGSKMLVSGTLLLSDNEADKGGALILDSSRISCNEGAKLVFKRNRARRGGGMHAYNSSVSTQDCRGVFAGNFAAEDGGAVKIASNPDLFHKEVALSGRFTGNVATVGGAIFTLGLRNFRLISADINHNSALDRGGGIFSLNSILTFVGPASFNGNRANKAGAMHLIKANVTFLHKAIFTHNMAWQLGGALYSVTATIYVHGAIYFTHNIAREGGAVYLLSETYFVLNYGAQFNSHSNIAIEFGGGIYHYDQLSPLLCNYHDVQPGFTYISNFPYCFLQFEILTFSPVSYQKRWPNITSFNDSAGIDGGFLFGGLMDRCKLRDILVPTTVYSFLRSNHILTVTANRTQAVSSAPLKLCFCDDHNNSLLGCSGTVDKVVNRGKAFTVTLIAIGQGGSVASTTVTVVTSNTGNVKLHQNPQILPRYCHQLTYNVFSTVERETLVLYPDGPCRDIGYARIQLHLTLLPCPDGFVLESNGRCECDKRLLEFNVSCVIDEDIHLTRKAGSKFWIGAEYRNGSYQGLILYRTCPIEYCRTDEVNMTLEDLDLQCSDGRTGILCGGCRKNYSITVGGSKCKVCSNSHLLLASAFAAAGIALVAFISVIRLTVAMGMINGLILYANIVQVNRKLFFPADTTNILTVFVAWLNLDLGFETCF